MGIEPTEELFRSLISGGVAVAHDRSVTGFLGRPVDAFRRGLCGLGMNTILASLADVPTLTLTERGQAQFRFPFAQEIIAELKDCVNGVTWNGTLRAWTVRVRAANIRAIGGFARRHGLVGTEKAEIIQERLFAQARETMIASHAPSDCDFLPPATLRGNLRPFQRAGVAFAVRAERCLIADEMGLGKTVETIATLETMGAFPAIIVCPASLKLNWQREFAAWLPHRTLRVVDGSAPPATEDVTIINYDILAKHVDALRARHPAAVVFDEGHLLKTAKCQRTLAAKKLVRGVRVRLLLTGTPVLNSPSELLSPLGILGRLDDLGGFWHFAKRYCGGKEVLRTTRGGVTKPGWDLSGASNLPELAARLRATCMVRRRKRDVLLELPPKQLSLVPVEIGAAERKEYDVAQRDVLDWIAARAGKDPVFRAAIAGLDEERQIAAILGRAQVAVDRAAQAEELVKIEALKQISARGKIPAAVEWIENFLATGEKLVVFAWHQEICDALAAKFAAPAITGATPLARRQKIVDDFQRKKDCPLVVLNLQAGGVGLTLTAASNVLVVEWPWTPALLDQAIDRCHRIGQHDAVTAWLMMGRRTIDQPIWKMLQNKRATAEGAVR